MTAISFARFIPELHKRGADVAFAAQPELTRLFDGQIDGATVAGRCQSKAGKIRLLRPYHELTGRPQDKRIRRKSTAHPI